MAESINPDVTEGAKPEATESERSICDANWSRYEYGRWRGHRSYCATARRNERFYLGGGEQWEPDVRRELEASGRIAAEINEIMPAINAAVGYQINNRVSFNFIPRAAGANEDRAATLTKVVKQTLDNCRYRWLETDVFEDGLIQQRGYLDVRVTFNDSLMAEACMEVLDPLDVIPDPDAKSPDPKDWSDVIVTRWVTMNEIEQKYGSAKRAELENSLPTESDWGDDSDDEGRSKFGDENSSNTLYDAWMIGNDRTDPRVRIIDRQHWRYVDTMVAITRTGDVRVVDGFPEQRIAAMVADGAQIITRKMRRVRWTVTTQDVVLFDDWSPFAGITVIPYFPYFRRGKTRGLVDNAVSPQEILNKATSSLIHAVNTTANSGWITWENTLRNMSPEELRSQGAKSGLHIEVAANTPAEKVPKKITPNPLPQGTDRIIEHAKSNLADVTVPDSLRGLDKGDMAGVAIQSRQFAAQQGLARALDNLSRFRHMLAGHLLNLIQTYYDEPRIMRITQTDPRSGKDSTVEMAVNQPAPDGSILNDLTIGEYDVVVVEQPYQVSFDNSQFQQAMEMRKEGVAIPDAFVVKHSTLAEKAEIIEAMDRQRPQTNPVDEAKAALLKAQAEKTQAETVVRNVEGIFSATEAAQNIAAVPQVAPLADDILGSAGYVDKDGPPLVPPLMTIPPTGVQPPPENTDPRFPRNPASPSVGMMAGIEGGG
jgi:hypothetical protein